MAADSLVGSLIRLHQEDRDAQDVDSVWHGFTKTTSGDPDEVVALADMAVRQFLMDVLVSTGN